MGARPGIARIRLGSLAIAQSMQVFGIGSIVIGQAIILLMAARAAFWVPEISATHSAEPPFGRVQYAGGVGSTSIGQLQVVDRGGILDLGQSCNARLLERGRHQPCGW
jgi:hypothetical protein